MIVALLVGLIAGGSLGVLLMGLLVAGDRADDELEREFHLIKHTCNPKCEPLANLHRGQWS